MIKYNIKWTVLIIIIIIKKINNSNKTIYDKIRIFTNDRIKGLEEDSLSDKNSMLDQRGNGL